jgi:hypothetical protein
MRGDTHLHLSHRIDILLELLARVPESCAAVARLMPGARDASDHECWLSLGGRLRRHIEATTAANEEEESKGRGLLMLKQVGSY